MPRACAIRYRRCMLGPNEADENPNRFSRLTVHGRRPGSGVSYIVGRSANVYAGVGLLRQSVQRNDMCTLAAPGVARPQTATARFLALPTSQSSTRRGVYRQESAKVAGKCQGGTTPPPARSLPDSLTVVPDELELPEDEALAAAPRRTSDHAQACKGGCPFVSVSTARARFAREWLGCFCAALHSAVDPLLDSPARTNRSNLEATPAQSLPCPHRPLSSRTAPSSFPSRP